MIERVEIKNYKSIKDLKLPLKMLNVLIGSNGVGKSNFISFFELIKAIHEQKFASYSLQKGGFNNLLYNGRKTSDFILGLLDFDNRNTVEYLLRPTQANRGYIEEVRGYFNCNFDSDFDKKYDNNISWNLKVWEQNVEESTLINNTSWRATNLNNYLDSFNIYHFHDTSLSSPMRQECNINDNEYLRDNGSNLAAYLYRLKETEEKTFRLIEGVIRSIAPYFKGFKLRKNPLSRDTIQLEWEEVGSDMYLNGYSFSDGTLRFIALATLLLQPNLPEVILIDEPELGLHPAAINSFAALVKRASKTSQVIISTQSTNLVNCFDVENVVTVDREGDQSVFQHLSKDELAVWMSEYNYSVSDLWEKNIIGGQL